MAGKFCGVAAFPSHYQTSDCAHETFGCIDNELPHTPQVRTKRILFEQKDSRYDGQRIRRLSRDERGHYLVYGEVLLLLIMVLLRQTRDLLCTAVERGTTIDSVCATTRRIRPIALCGSFCRSLSFG